MLAKTKSVIVVEDLYVSGMLKNHHLAQAISDVGFAAFRRQLLYTVARYGSQVVLADRWEPSSKTCSGCDWVDDDLELKDRVFCCRNPQCAFVGHRDVVGSVNMHPLAFGTKIAFPAHITYQRAGPVRVLARSKQPCQVQCNPPVVGARTRATRRA
jgi:putative transposase